MPLTGSKLRVRLQACGLHLAASVTIAALAAAVVFWLWYPAPYSSAAGGRALFFILVSVDVVAGPLITLIVFDRAKPRRELARDMAVVVMLQAVALGYGLHTMSIARPVALALEVDRFRVVRALDVVADELPLAPQGLRTLPWLGPRTVQAVVPDDSSERIDAVGRAMAGADIGARPKYWRPWADAARAEVRANARPVAPLMARSSAHRQVLADAMHATGIAAERIAYLPAIAPVGDLVVLVDRERGEPIGYAELDGF